MTNDKIQMTNESSMTNDKSKSQNKEKIKFNYWDFGDSFGF